MKNEINAVLENMTATTPEPEDYTGEDGLLYCGKCRKPKEAYFAPDKAAIFGRDRHPAECDCQRAAREEREAAEKRRRHLDTVEEPKRRGFTDPTMTIELIQLITEKNNILRPGNREEVSIMQLKAVPFRRLLCYACTSYRTRCKGGFLCHDPEIKS